MSDLNATPVTPAAPVCDCLAISKVATQTPRGLALFARSSHLSRRVLRALDVTPQAQPDTYWLPDHAFHTLPPFMITLSSAERADLLAAPCPDPRSHPDPWSAAPLQDWLHRLDTTWFTQAAQHLHFHLQPIVDVTCGIVHGYEALVRARHAGQEIGAGPLLRAAKAHGQSRAFDAHARRSAIHDVFPLLDPRETLFINFAPGIVYNPDVCLQTTFQACREVGADIRRLTFEVTESEAFPDLGLLKRILERYRAEGAQVALDDLGAGHTSLSYLDTLRPDVVKLDRGLVTGVQADDPRVPLMAALIRYAHDLGIRVVAEGVETEVEYGLIRELGADYAQGYFLGRPAPRPLAHWPAGGPA